MKRGLQNEDHHQRLQHTGVYAKWPASCPVNKLEVNFALITPDRKVEEWQFYIMVDHKAFYTTPDWIVNNGQKVPVIKSVYLSICLSLLIIYLFQYAHYLSFYLSTYLFHLHIIYYSLCSYLFHLLIIYFICSYLSITAYAHIYLFQTAHYISIYLSIYPKGIRKTIC